MRTVTLAPSVLVSASDLPLVREILEQLGELVGRALGDDVAALVADLIEMLADVLDRQLGVVVALGKADEKAGDAPPGSRVDLAGDRAVLVDKPGCDR